MKELWKAAKRGWCSGIDLSLKCCKVFFIWLPCIALFSLPAYLVGYAWCWIVGGFRAGELGFHNTTTEGAEIWRVEIQVKEVIK